MRCSDPEGLFIPPERFLKDYALALQSSRRGAWAIDGGNALDQLTQNGQLLVKIVGGVLYCQGGLLQQSKRSSAVLRKRLPGVTRATARTGCPSGVPPCSPDGTAADSVTDI